MVSQKYSYCWYVIWQEQELNDISVDVKSCGLWIHKKHPHLGANPNRLIWENNNLVVIEMKCLKILKRHKIQEFIDTFENGKMSDQVKRQQLLVHGRNLVLKSHIHIVFRFSYNYWLAIAFTKRWPHYFQRKKTKRK